MKYKNRILLGLIAVTVIAWQLPVMFHLQGSEVHGYSVEKTLSKPITDLKTSSADSFAATISYSDPDGYKGTMSKNGSSFVKSGSYNPGNPGHAHTTPCYHKHTKCDKMYQYYCGSCKRNTIVEQGSNSCGNCHANGHLSGGSFTGDYSCEMENNEIICGKSEGDGYIPSSDTRVYQQNYSGTAYKVVTEYPKLVSVKIVQEPNETRYVEYENFNPTGMIVEATYADGHKEIIEMEESL